MKANSISLVKVSWHWLLAIILLQNYCTKGSNTNSKRIKFSRGSTLLTTGVGPIILFNLKTDLCHFIYSNLNLHNPLTPHFVLILLKGLKIFQHMSCVTVIFCPIMFQKCWFSFLASDSNFAIAQSNIGQITKSLTFLKSALNGL